MTITYLLYTDEWRVEWDGYVSIQHDLATAIDRVICLAVPAIEKSEA